MALTVAGCTNTMSLGAAGPLDGGDATVITSNDAGDAQPDVLADTGSDVLADTHMDGNTDGSGQSCVDNGITYHSGDVVLRPGCQLSCICTDGVIGACTGIPCQTDGSADGDPILGAAITMGTGFGTSIQVSIDSSGEAQRMVTNPGVSLPMPPPPRTFPPGAPEVTRFLYHLQRVGDLTNLTVACPLANPIFVRMPPPTVISGDLSCPLVNPTPDSLALIQDILALLGITESNVPSDDSINAQACTATGGELANNLCCSGADNFPDSCAVGACTCAPTNLQVVDTCVCPNGGCFVKSVGCLGPANVCTVGADETCNDNPAINSLHGHCMADGRCSCITTIGSTLVAASGKCS